MLNLDDILAWPLDERVKGMPAGPASMVVDDGYAVTGAIRTFF